MATKLECPKCKGVIFSIWRHDFNMCPCGSVFIDGGDDYTRNGYPVDMNPNTIKVEKATPAEVSKEIKRRERANRRAKKNAKI